jgi:hypothetical protein
MKNSALNNFVEGSFPLQKNNQKEGPKYNIPTEQSEPDTRNSVDPPRSRAKQQRDTSHQEKFSMYTMANKNPWKQHPVGPA